MVPENVCVFLPNQKAERRRPFGTGLIRHCPQGLSSPFFTFLRAIFFSPFRLSLARTICPWVSEDDSFSILFLRSRQSNGFRRERPLAPVFGCRPREDKGDREAIP